MRSGRFIRSRLLARFAGDARATALVEFALILPLLLLLFLGSVEASSLLTVDRRVTVISGTIGDLVARWDAETGAIPSGTLTDYFQAAQGIIYPYSTSPLQQVVSVVRVAADGSTAVEWSCAVNGGTARAVDSAYASLPDNMNLLARGSWVVAAEASYSYRPVLGLVFTEALDLYNQSFYLPRFEKEIVGPIC